MRPVFSKNKPTDCVARRRRIAVTALTIRGIAAQLYAISEIIPKEIKTPAITVRITETESFETFLFL